MAAGSRLSKFNHGFFLLPASIFQTCFLHNIFEQTVGHYVGDL